MYLLILEDATGESSSELIHKLHKTYKGAVDGALKAVREMAVDREQQDMVDALDALEKKGIFGEEEIEEIIDEMGDTYFWIHDLPVEK